MTELRRRMIADMRLHELAEGTQRTYVEAVKNLARHYNRPPDQLREADIRDFFVYLTQTRRLARSTVRVYLFALKFFYRKTLRRHWPVLDLIRLRRSKKLPVVLSPQEVRQLLPKIRRDAARVAAVMMYSCGLRVSEAIRLTASDIDSRRMVVWVHNGKGAKDRYVPLPRRTLELLRDYWRRQRPESWLFPAHDPSRPIDRGAVGKSIKAAARDAAIRKNVSCHTLRHSYATHLLEEGVDLRVIQGLLGHRSLRSTARYAHLTERTIRTVQPSIDQMMADL